MVEEEGKEKQGMWRTEMIFIMFIIIKNNIIVILVVATWKAKK